MTEECGLCVYPGKGEGGFSGHVRWDDGLTLTIVIVEYGIYR